MKKVLSLVLAAVLLFTLCACGSSPSNANNAANNANNASNASNSNNEGGNDKVYNFKWASNESESTLKYLQLEKPIMDLITEKSGGRITFTFYPSGSLASNGNTLKGCQDGICDFGMDTIADYPGTFLYSELLLTPGINLGKDYDEKSENIRTYMRQYGAKEFADNSIYLISMSPAPPVYLASTVPVEDNSSLNGKIVCASPVYTPLFNDFSLSTSWIIPPEQYESLHLNVIDAILNAIGPISAFKLYEVLDYAYEVPFAFVPSTVMMSMKAYNSLPEDLKAVLDELQCSDEIIAINKAYVEATINDVMSETTSGNPNFLFTELPGDVSASMQAGAAAAIESKVEELNSAGLDGSAAKELLDSFSR